MLSVLGRARGERRRRLQAGVAAGIGALVLAAGLAASAPAARASSVSYLWFENSIANQLMVFGGPGLNSFAFDSMAPGTSPAATIVGDGSGIDFAYVNGSGHVIAAQAFIGTTDLGTAMAGTSPAIVALTTGAWLVAYIDPSGTVVLDELGDRQDFQFGQAAPGTSPALAALPNGHWEVAYQTTNGKLVTEGADNHGEWPLSLWPGTSPAITGLTNGSYEVAFQANTSDLWTVGSDNHRDWKLGMMAGTSPAITLANDGPADSYEVAFQANTGNLWTVGADNHDSWGAVMDPATSPAIMP